MRMCRGESACLSDILAFTVKNFINYLDMIILGLQISYFSTNRLASGNPMGKNNLYLFLHIRFYITLVWCSLGG